jgi:predicted ATPase
MFGLLIALVYFVEYLNRRGAAVRTTGPSTEVFRLRAVAPAQAQWLEERHGSAVGVANATMLRGWARVMQGHIEEGLAVMREGLAAWRTTGSKFHVPYRLARAAEAYLVAGEIEDGLRLICEAADQSGDCWFAPELHRLKGELLLKAGRHDEVEGCLEQALKAAQEQGARLLELRAAMSFSRVLQAQGRRNEARDLLAPVYTWFTEGLDTADLQQAKALLDQVN